MMDNHARETLVNLLASEAEESLMKTDACDLLTAEQQADLRSTIAKVIEASYPREYGNERRIVDLRRDTP